MVSQQRVVADDRILLLSQPLMEGVSITAKGHRKSQGEEKEKTFSVEN